MDRDVKLGLVGAGYWGQKLLPKFLAARRVVVQAVCDIHEGNRSEIQKKFPHIPTMDSLDALLASPELEAVVIVTPPASHFAMAKAVLDAGKHVWIEKPLALHVDEGRRLVAAARAAQRTLFVDHTFLYDPAIRTIRELIRQGELGEIYHVFLQRLNLGRIKRDSNVWWNSAPHDASIILYLLPAAPTTIALHGYRYLQSNLEDLNMAVIEMADGASAFIYHNWLYPENTAKLTVVGSRRFLVYEGKFDKRALTIYDYDVDRSNPQGLSLTDLPTTIPSRVVAERKLDLSQGQEPLAAAVDDFLESVRDGKEPVSNGEFSLQVLAMLDAGERSLRAHGQSVPINV